MRNVGHCNNSTTTSKWPLETAAARGERAEQSVSCCLGCVSEVRLQFRQSSSIKPRQRARFKVLQSPVLAEREKRSDLENSCHCFHSANAVREVKVLQEEKLT